MSTGNLRVLWMIDSLGPGGAESLMPSLLEHLSSQGVESRVCVLQSRLGNPIAAELMRRGLPVDLVQVESLHSLGQILKLFGCIRKNKPDVIHTQLETSDILGNILARVLGIPSVSTLHTLIAPSRKRTSRLRKSVHRMILRLFCHRVIAVSDAAKKHFIQLGMPQEKLLTIYNGIDVSRFRTSPSKPDSRKNLFDCEQDDLILTTVAVLREPKGIQYMLGALPSVLDKLPNVCYAIVGDGDYRKSLEELAQTLGIFDRVRFLGFRENIPEVLAASNLFVFPSLNDALPTVLIEAMAAGLPIVATNVGGIPEMIVDKENGLLVPPGNESCLANACVQLLSDHEVASRLKEAGHAVVMKHFNIQRQVDDLLGLYIQLYRGIT